MARVLRAGVEPHRRAGDDPDHSAVEKPETRLLEDELARRQRPQLSQREPPQGDRERLAARVAGLASEDRKERGKHDDAIDGVLEDPDHGGRHEGRQEVELEPGVAEAEGPQQVRGDPLFLLDADHAAACALIS